MLKELQSIGLDVKILNENQEEVAIKELDDEDEVNENEEAIQDVMGETVATEEVEEQARDVEELIHAGQDDDVIADLGTYESSNNE